MLYRLVYARPADQEEAGLGEQFLADAQADNTGMTPWERYCQVLLLANEFLFVD